MRPAQGGAAAKHQTEWHDAGSAYRRQRLHDVPVLFDKCWARQPPNDSGLRAGLAGMGYRSTTSSRLPSRSRREKRPFTRTPGLTGTCVERPSL